MLALPWPVLTFFLIKGSLMTARKISPYPISLAPDEAHQSIRKQIFE